MGQGFRIQCGAVWKLPAAHTMVQVCVCVSVCISRAAYFRIYIFACMHTQHFQRAVHVHHVIFSPRPDIYMSMCAHIYMRAQNFTVIAMPCTGRDGGPPSPSDAHHTHQVGHSEHLT